MSFRFLIFSVLSYILTPHLTLYVHTYISLPSQQENMSEVAEGQGKFFLESPLHDEPSCCSRAAVGSLLPTFHFGIQATVSTELVRSCLARDKSCTCIHVITALLPFVLAFRCELP